MGYAPFLVPVDFVLSTPEAATGVAPISVDASGQNSIIIVNGANDLLTSEEVTSAGPLIKEAKVLLTQLEIKVDFACLFRLLRRSVIVFSTHSPDLSLPCQPESTLAALRIAASSKVTTRWAMHNLLSKPLRGCVDVTHRYSPFVGGCSSVFSIQHLPKPILRKNFSLSLISCA